ncbi:hypothetical protein WJX84_004614 [Apatococcus fuscideae]|uniref:tRNA (guanine(46)-N(7))-methyltransferase n=1 Tax=Apatococcus fuscideae TaxID=2026836 RepID=A0AAW1SQP6_9CHLO
MRIALHQFSIPGFGIARRRLFAIPALPSSREVLIREAHNAAWPEVNLDTLQVNKSGRRVRQHVNPFKEELQVLIDSPDWTQIFHQPSLPLTVDLGCGPGRFLLASAKRFPANNYLGLEIRQPLIDRANDWSRAMELAGQVHFIYANANVQLSNLLRSYPGPVDLITIQFPDPHYKTKHKKRRIVQPALVQTIKDALRPGGRLFMQSDVLEVAEAMRDEVEAFAAAAFDTVQGHLPGPSQEMDSNRSMAADGQRAWSACGWLADNPIGVPTEREVVSLELKLPVYRVLLIRKDH